MSKIRQASEADYTKIQGGIPTVHKDSEITIITHNYPGGQGMEIRTTHNYEPVIIDGVEYNTNLLRRFHGEPCEKQSFMLGGHGYPRKSENE